MRSRSLSSKNGSDIKALPRAFFMPSKINWCPSLARSVRYIFTSWSNMWRKFSEQGMVMFSPFFPSLIGCGVKSSFICRDIKSPPFDKVIKVMLLPQVVSVRREAVYAPPCGKSDKDELHLTVWNSQNDGYVFSYANRDTHNE